MGRVGGGTTLKHLMKTLHPIDFILMVISSHTQNMEVAKNTEYKNNTVCVIFDVLYHYRI